LTDVQDVAGNAGNVVGLQMGVLVGNVDTNRLVDGNDLSAVQNRTRRSANASDLIDGNDVSITQGQTRPRFLNSKH
jgi:hypothetical protein